MERRRWVCGVERLRFKSCLNSLLFISTVYEDLRTTSPNHEDVRNLLHIKTIDVGEPPWTRGYIRSPKSVPHQNGWEAGSIKDTERPIPKPKILNQNQSQTKATKLDPGCSRPVQTKLYRGLWGAHRDLLQSQSSSQTKSHVWVGIAGAVVLTLERNESENLDK